jgi:antitoxin HigA-1
MKNPPHPGLAVKHDCLEALGLSVTEAAQGLGVTRQTLNDLIHGHRGISPEMALRLDQAFGGGAETWIRLQAAYDLAQARARVGKLTVKAYGRRPRGGHGAALVESGRGDAG